MIIGVPKEVKVHEYRVAMVPAGVQQLTAAGHEVLIQSGAGVGSSITDAAYESVGARIIETADELWKASEMVVKVKEPVAEEHERIQHGQTLFTYFHLAAVPELAPVLVEQKAAAIAYETVELADGRLPMLHPMSVVAGKMATQAGASLLERGRGGKGILLGGVPGVRRGRVVVLGGGTSGTAAAKIAVGLGASVTIIDISLPRLEYLDDVFGSRVNLVASNPISIEEEVRRADLVVGAVLVPGRRAPTLVSRELVAAMDPGSVVVDIAVDQGGCIETIRPTTHDAPTYVVDDVLHYGVTNMPGAVAHTSTYALTNATTRYALRIAEMGPIEAAKADPALAKGFNTYDGRVTHQAVAEDLGYEFSNLFN
ncbi:MAG: alanine dehydrogenase [Myxococcota bacterium]